MPNEAPINEVITLQKQGRTIAQITKELQNKGYSLQEINEAINQASIKSGVGGPSVPEPPTSTDDMQESILRPQEMPLPPTPEMPPAPTFQPQPAAQSYPQFQPAMAPAMPAEPSISYEDVQSLVEEVIEEKWKELMVTIGDIPSWKSETMNDLEAVKQEILRIERRFEDMQTAIFGRVKEYGSSMQDLGSEMKALEKVFEKIIEPMTTNIKDLERLTGELKTRKQAI